MLKLQVTRDSVAMGDDAYAPHFAEFKMSSQALFSEFFHLLRQYGYLAQVQGVNHRWIVKVDGQVVAELVGNQPYPKDERLLSVPLAKFKHLESIPIHFDYISAKS